MITVYAVYEDEAQLEKALTQFGKREITSRNMRILGLHDTQAVFHARRAGVSANVGLSLAAAPHVEEGRRERIKHLLEDNGLGGHEYEGLAHSIESGDTVLAVDVAEEQADEAKRVLRLEGGA